jgi:hypothetical protein
MKRFLLAGFAITLSLVSSVAPVLAHHSFAAEYDANKPYTLKGKVTKFEWQNPHVYYYVDVTGADGKVTNWAVEGAAPNGLYRLGWRKDSLKPGDVITVEGFLAKSGNAHMSGRTVTLADGKKVLSGFGDGGPNDRYR